MTFSFSTMSLSRLSTVDIRLQEIMKEAIKHSPIDFGIPMHGGKRAAEEQFELFKAGRSKCDGYKNPSYHQTGLAVDVYAYVDGKASWDEKHLTLIAGNVLSTAIRLGHVLEWGGNWISWQDYPHFQLK